MGILDGFTEEPQEFYPGSRRPINRDPKAEEVPREGWDEKPVMLAVAGYEREFFTTGHLAKALGRKPGTIRSWEKKGYIPKATYRKPSDDPRGARRLYTRQQIEGLARLAEEEGLFKKTNWRYMNFAEFTRRGVVLFRALAAQENA